MTRDAHIPLVLWVSVAILVHLGGGSGAVEVAQSLADRAEVRAMVRAVRAELRAAPMTVELLDEVTQATPVEAPAAAEGPAAEAGVAQVEVPPESPKRHPEAKPPNKPEVAEKQVPPPKAPETKPSEALPTPAFAVPPPPPPPADKRIAIKQQAVKDQPDNPTAERIADDANHVDEETRARNTSHDQDDPEPEFGARTGSLPTPGDSEEQKMGHAEDRGKVTENTRAPGEDKPDSTESEHHNPTKPDAKTAPLRVANATAPKGAAEQRGARTQAAEPPPAPGGSGPASPEVALGEHGGYTLDPANPGGDGKTRSPGLQKVMPRSQVRVGSLGFGAPGLANGTNLNLSQTAFEQAVGFEKLKEERAADGASRRSRHIGANAGDKFQRWRAAIENYVPSVKLGNQTALNAASVPFASYLNAIHNRIHPIFAEEFLASLDGLSAGHELNKDLVAHVEIVLRKEDGRIVRLGMTKMSASTAFNVVALNSVDRAAPFGKAPDAVVSPDGNVYLHWEFHRDPFDACTTRNARPFLLSADALAAIPSAPTPRRAPGPIPSDDLSTPRPILPLR